jgi:C1A family cysteine protease
MNENMDRANMPTRIYLFMVLLVCLVATTFAQTPVEAPLDPAFISCMQQARAGEFQMMTAQGHGLGYIPSPVRFNTQLPSDILRETVAYPSSFDLRTLGKVTSVKDQGNCGSCWTFATMGSIESRWLVTGSGTYDLSENGLKECHGFLLGGCSGGNEYMATAYLSRDSGPISESDDPYVALDGSCTSGLAPVAYLTHAYFLPKDASTIKNFVSNSGGVYTSMYWDGASYRSSDNTYYYSGTATSNHAVLIVGWDDNKVTAGGTGAWIIKNSWGASWGEGGYFYVAYNDTQILSSNAFWPNRIDQNSDATICRYDELGTVSVFGFTNYSYGYGLVKFVASGLQTITKIATWIPQSNSTVDFYVYDDFNGTTLSNQLGSLTGQSCTYAGYYTFDLPTPINISSGNDFYVEVKYSTANPQPVYPLPMETASSGYSAPTIETGKCWTSLSGSSPWYALGGGTSYPWDLCIRAYAISIPLPIQLASSSATVVRNSDVEIAWKTVSETNNYGFEVCRRRGETGGWTKIGFVQGHGTTLAPQSYSYADPGLSFGKYYYRIKQVDLDGKSETFPEVSVMVGVGPSKFILAQNYPNPFNPSTAIEFVVPQNGYASVKVYNLLGQEVATAFTGNVEAGKINTALLNASNLPSGIYFYTLRNGGNFETKRMVLMK